MHTQFKISYEELEKSSPELVKEATRRDKKLNDDEIRDLFNSENQYKDLMKKLNEKKSGEKAKKETTEKKDSNSSILESNEFDEKNMKWNKIGVKDS